MRTKIVNGVPVPFTPEEEAQRDSDEAKALQEKEAAERIQFLKNRADDFRREFTNTETLDELVSSSLYILVDELTAIRAGAPLTSEFLKLRAKLDQIKGRHPAPVGEAPR